MWHFNTEIQGRSGGPGITPQNAASSEAGMGTMAFSPPRCFRGPAAASQMILFIFRMLIKPLLEQDNPVCCAVPSIQALLLQVPDLKWELQSLSKSPLLPRDDFSLCPWDPGRDRTHSPLPNSCRRASCPFLHQPWSIGHLAMDFPLQKQQGLLSGNVPPP